MGRRGDRSVDILAGSEVRRGGMMANANGGRFCVWSMVTGSGDLTRIRSRGSDRTLIWRSSDTTIQLKRIMQLDAKVIINWRSDYVWYQ
jgi:hypothetical protein